MWLKDKRVLFVVTSHAQLGRFERPTGLYLSELLEPLAVLRDLGVEVEVASPQGGPAPVEPCSRSTDLTPLAASAASTVPLESCGNDYDAYLVVGGRGALWDLARDYNLARRLSEAFAAGKVVGAISQGSAALLGLTGHGDESLLRGRRVTSSSDEEELEAGWAKALPFSLEGELRVRGARVETAPPWASHVVAEGRLVTGQNPGSAPGVARAMARLLAET